MIPFGARPPHRRILAAALAAAAAATIALTSGYPGSGGWLRSKAPAAVNGAEAATASAPVPAPAPARRKSDAPAPAMSSTLSDQRGVLWYLLMEAARPQPLFAR
jgi:hypothetical protein